MNVPPMCTRGRLSSPFRNSRATLGIAVTPVSQLSTVSSFALKCSHVGPSPAISRRASSQDSRNASAPANRNAQMKPGGVGASCSVLRAVRPPVGPDCLLTADVMFNVEFLRYWDNPAGRTRGTTPVLPVKPKPRYLGKTCEPGTTDDPRLARLEK